MSNAEPVRLPGVPSNHGGHLKAAYNFESSYITVVEDYLMIFVNVYALQNQTVAQYLFDNNVCHIAYTCHVSECRETKGERDADIITATAGSPAAWWCQSFFNTGGRSFEGGGNKIKREGLCQVDRGDFNKRRSW